MEFTQINELCGGDVEYRNAMIDLYLQLFKDFPLEYAQAMKNGNKESASQIRHKAKPALITVGMNDLLMELDRGRELLEPLHSLSLREENVFKVRNLCQQYFLQLQKMR